MITKDAEIAFRAFLNGYTVEYHRPNIDDDNSWDLIDKYSPLFVFQNDEAKTGEDCKLFRITVEVSNE